ncbi:class I SAM-dependent methyltransferase [Chelativorans salis]|uniref:Methyltransferase domain-containing protein n=1 Tax=Chelativorans salis TaxID=2978478 RepID=A0ABT2LV13_9HYPH|nr:class I SAM-dependent methyltransferase [Chelativorans sp. EGI FJ00035]MCT7378365.1 methyltransferase domain-containing protein [Chelativorans sp. EGI FJ00035]
MNKERAGSGSRTVAMGHIEEGSAFLELSAAQKGSTGPETRPRSPALPSPARLTEQAFAFQRTAALKAAVGLDVFTAIGEGHDTLVALAKRCRAAKRGVRILCDYLVVLGLLEREGERYRAVPDANAYLNRQSPAFIGDALDFIASETALKAALDDPAAVARKGGTVLDNREHFVAPNHPNWRVYARALAPMMARSAAFLAELHASHGDEFDSILDIAAGPGQNGIALARRIPNARVTAVDWPSVLEIASENAQAAGLGERWQALPGNALNTDFGGTYDAVLIARFLHLLAPDACEALLCRAHTALAPGGRIVVLQLILNDDRVSPPFAAMMNFSAIATTPAGQIPTASERCCSARRVSIVSNGARLWTPTNGSSLGIKRT